MNVKKDIVWRVVLVYFIFLIFGLVVIGKVVYMQVFEKKAWTDKAEKMTLKDIEIEPNRGNIYACNGKLLAGSVPHYEIRMDMVARGLTDREFSKGIDSLALCLSRLFADKSKEVYRNDLLRARKNGERFHLLQRRASYNEMKALRTFPIFRLGKNNGGLICVQDNIRFQPHGNLASRTIGYINKGEAGNTVGIEGAFDEYLRGIKGIRLMQKVSGGIWVPIHDGNEVDPKDGMDIITTIDIDLQDLAEQALYRQLLVNNAHHGSAVVMEVATGEIKAIANLERDEYGNYAENYNYALGENIEPGSTFKLPVLMAALDDGYVQLDDTIDTGHGSITFYDKTIHDNESKGFGKITVQKIFEVSSNVGMATIITKYYTGKEKKFIDHLYKMHLNEPLKLEIRGEADPEIKYPGDKLWSGISLPMIAHGYEIKVTPLQILTLYNAIANNGRMVKPQFVKEIRYRDNLVKRFGVQVISSSVCSSSTLRKAKIMLEGVVQHGTAKNLNNPIYKIAGKTGTAQIANKKLGYLKEYVSSFAGYFPADNPKYSCMVSISSPSNNLYYGNVVAGPVFKEIADKVFATGLDMYPALKPRGRHDTIEAPSTKAGFRADLERALDELDIPTKKMNDKQGDWVLTQKTGNEIGLYNLTVRQSLVPNVVGMGLMDALYLLENNGLRVSVKGKGTVVSQSMTPGSRASSGGTIFLDMSMN
jgi:cell division protein FtsI (penicillin-binding protein 3)